MKVRLRAQTVQSTSSNNFLKPTTPLYISRRVLLKTKVFLRQKLPPDFFLPKGGYIELKSPHESYLE